MGLGAFYLLYGILGFLYGIMGFLSPIWDYRLPVWDSCVPPPHMWVPDPNPPLQSMAAVTSPPVGLCRVLAVPPDPIELPQVGGDPGATVTIPPPVAHTGPGPVHMRLLSYQLREGQVWPHNLWGLGGVRGLYGGLWGSMGDYGVVYGII